jgi:hypothetical protein
MGADEQSRWCSSSNISGPKCKPISGVCAPADFDALEKFKALQNQLNRVAKASGWSLINVDGRIGSQTVALYNKAQGGNLVGCDMLAGITVSGTSVATIKMIADQMGAPVMVKPPITSRPSTFNAKTGQVEHPPGLAITDTVFGLVSSPFGLVIAAGLGYAAWRLYKSPSPGGGGKRRAPTRRRR